MINATRFEARLFDLKNRFVQSLPGRVAEIAETLRHRQGDDDAAGTLDRQFHNLAGTAGTFGFHSIAAAATDGFDECVEIGSGRIHGEARYLWSILDELAYAASGGVCEGATFHLMNGALAPLELTER